MQWLLTTHVRRSHRHYPSSGPVWQGRFKAFPIQQDAHLLTVLRYIERNPLRAGLVTRAEGRKEDWMWTSLRERGVRKPWLHPAPVRRPKDWVAWVNVPMTEADVETLRHSVNCGTPFSSKAWGHRTARRVGLEASLNPRGRLRTRSEK